MTKAKYGESIRTQLDDNGDIHYIKVTGYGTISESHWDNDRNAHRDDGPAIIHHDGDLSWYHHGKRHRIDGPAIEWRNGNKWYYDDKELSFDDWLEEIEFNYGQEYAMKMKLKWAATA